ncbi:Calcineurin-like phosphoesterase [Mariniflexile rhizosphaerae]|uniref:metallophosphoesterase family protein n=1 Tax=unclassified Mariniflexile TaxID=2643887 RepID=UPI000CAD41FA|nr:metallophosphoesterase [Mariniflexile sp. TRM1-10]AXP82483.1 Calcineurin-like phosphoesterase [Mariniflexile sp. TRM1-10]PLB17811.1 MAG: hypothetical protein TRG1_3351 [Flavobacteriaceae bacterium FS1-H7996/R]
MRIVHLSDIHLSKNNYDEFHDNYREALINDLAEFHSTNKIDLIVITGDLVDKGGHSLLKMDEFKLFNSPYTVFEEVFIKPISSILGLQNENFLFIPGNHDIDENGILWVDEKSMKQKINKDTIKQQLELNKLDFNFSNERIKLFKEFEETFHKDTINYEYSNNESVYIYKDDSDKNVGFILINDSWRCSTCKLDDGNLNNHFFGSKQLYWAIQKLQNQDLNLDRIICLFHHSVDDFTEKNEVVKFLMNKDVDLFLFGHHHSIKSEKIFNPAGSCFGFRGRAALNKPDEQIDKFQPGYQIIDIDLFSNRISQIHHRKYVFDNPQFVYDTQSAPPNGIDNNSSYSGNGYEFPYKKSKSNYNENLKVEDFKRN